MFTLCFANPKSFREVTITVLAAEVDATVAEWVGDMGWMLLEKREWSTDECIAKAERTMQRESDRARMAA
jgi:hypothetical protein